MTTVSIFFAAASSSTVTLTMSSSVTPINIQSLVTIKLTKDNYLLWTAQVVPYLRGQRLYGYVDGTILPPPVYIPNLEFASSKTAPKEIPNPKYFS